MGPDFSLVKNGHIQLKNLAVFLEEMVAFEKSTFTRPRLSNPRREQPPRSDYQNQNQNNNNNNNNNNNPHTKRYRPPRYRNRTYRPKDPQVAENTQTQPATTIEQVRQPTEANPVPPPTSTNPDTNPVDPTANPTDTTPNPTPTNTNTNPRPPRPTDTTPRAPKPTTPKPKPTPHVRDPAKLYADWRGKYYQFKLGIDITKNDQEIQRICRSYVDSLVWVLRYYFSGVPSWSWFYPFHYAPIACDLLAYIRTLIESGHESTEPITFPMDAPIKPLYHLMSILPVESVQCVPASYQPLMTDPASPVADLYPTNFQIDSNGNRFGSQSVVLVEFVDANRLVQHLIPLDDTLTEQEKKRNTFGTDQIIASASLTPSSPPYHIQKEVLSPQDVHWVRRRSGFALPKPAENPVTPSPSEPVNSTEPATSNPTEPTNPSEPAQSTEPTEPIKPITK